MNQPLSRNDFNISVNNLFDTRFLGKLIDKVHISKRDGIFISFENKDFIVLTPPCEGLEEDYTFSEVDDFHIPRKTSLLGFNMTRRTTHSKRDLFLTLSFFFDDSLRHVRLRVNHMSRMKYLEFIYGSTEETYLTKIKI